MFSVKHKDTVESGDGRLSRDGFLGTPTLANQEIEARISAASVVKRRRRQEPALQLPETA